VHRSCGALVVLAGLLPGLAGADPTPVDRALALVLEAHPQIQARQREAAAVADRPSWSSDLSLSLTQGRNEYGTQDAGQATLSIHIPLVGGDGDREKARAQRELAAERASIREAFLDAVNDLRARAESVAAAKERRALAKDRLDYRREAVEQGLKEPDALWQETERLQEAEHRYRDRARALHDQREAVARRFGGSQWTRLQDYLGEIAN